MRIRFAALLGTVAGAAVLASAFAGGAQAQSLEAALISAYANNPTLQAERAAARATDEELPQALANWRPEVNVTGSVGWQSYRNYTGTGTDKGQFREPAALGVELSQSIFRGWRTINSTERAEELVKSGVYQLEALEQTTLLQAATTYMDVVRDQATLELNRANERVLRRQLEATRDRFRVGEITRTDVHQAEARVARAEADRIQAENNLHATRATFLQRVGIAAEKLERPEAPADLPLTLEDAVKVAVVSHPNVRWFEAEVGAAREFVEVVKGELLPSLDLTAEAARAWQASGENTMTRDVNAKLTLTVPIYQKGDVYSRIREARQTVAENIHKVDKERRDAREKATLAWEALSSARAQIQSYLSQIKATEVALDGVEREAQVGSRTVLDVLDAEQEVVDAKVSLVRAQRDEMVAIFELKEAMGGMTAEKLNLRVDLYDPKAHYNEVRDKWFGGRSTGDSSTMDVD